jgi:hypothetical protein
MLSEISPKAFAEVGGAELWAVLTYDEQVCMRSKQGLRFGV